MNLVTRTAELVYQMDRDQLEQVEEAIELRRQFLLEVDKAAEISYTVDTVNEQEGNPCTL